MANTCSGHGNGSLAKRLHRFKPGASAKVHIMAAGLMWTLAGLGLLLVGAFNLTSMQCSEVEVLIIFALSIAAGCLKGKFILGKVAIKNIERVRSWKNETRCLGGFLPLKSWLLIIAMICLGRLLRTSPLPRQLVWGIYLAVGTALLTASRHFWESWLDFDRLTHPGP